MQHNKTTIFQTHILKKWYKSNVITSQHLPVQVGLCFAFKGLKKISTRNRLLDCFTMQETGITVGLSDIYRRKHLYFLNVISAVLFRVRVSFFSASEIDMAYIALLFILLTLNPHNNPAVQDKLRHCNWPKGTQGVLWLDEIMRPGLLSFHLTLYPPWHTG